MTTRVVVPAEPTEEMHAAGWGSGTSKARNISGNVWDAMIAAAPPYEPSEAEVEAVYKVWKEWQFPADGSRLDQARAALIAADKARRGTK